MILVIVMGLGVGGIKVWVAVNLVRRGRVNFSREVLVCFLSV